eukprot:1286819-Rhodomonas_salina.1
MVVKGFAALEVTAGAQAKGHAAASCGGLCALEFRMRLGCNVCFEASCSAIVQGITGKDGHSGFAEQMSEVWCADHVGLLSYCLQGGPGRKAG